MQKQLKFTFCLSSFLYNNLQSYRENVLILDTRNNESFSVQRVSNSINISHNHIAEHMESKKSDAPSKDQLSLDIVSEIIPDKDKARFSQRRRMFCILIISESSFPQEFIEMVRKLTGADSLMDFFEVPQKHLEDDLRKAIEDMEDKNSALLGLKLFELMQQDRVRELFILLDGSNRFFEKYPYMDLSFHPSPTSFLRTQSLAGSQTDVTFNFPNDIWEGRVFLGSFNQASQDIIVNSLEVTHIVNVTAECKNVYEEKGIKYLHIIILDETQVTLSTFFKEAFDFIDTALKDEGKNKILVHCAKGKSRSATITTMFLMKKFSWSFDKALTYVKMKRRIVDPNYGFLKQLEEFEQNNFAFMV